MKTIYLVLPCYNEEEVLRTTASKLEEKINTLIKNKIINEDSKIVFVDDGSKDRTWKIIKSLHLENKLFGGLKLSKNQGHQNALLAGLLTLQNSCDAIISLDADLQDDINVIDTFIERYYDGAHIVYGVRSKREKDTFFKKTSAELFYKLMQALGVKIVYNHADYRLMSSEALNALANFKEVNLFLRGIVPLIGYQTDVVYYERNERCAGTSKYPLKKMLSFALEGITSFSITPIRIVFYLGLIMFISSLIVTSYFILLWLFGGTVHGWTTIVASIWLLGGIQLLCLGVIGEYIGKMYMETKSRPRFIIEQNLFDNK